jgi:hypothetical protein
VSADRIRELRLRALRARDLAAATLDKQVEANLLSYASDLEKEAAKLEAQILPPAAIEASAQAPTAGPEAIAAMKSKADGEPDPSGG